MYKFSKYNLVAKNYMDQYYIYNVLSKNCDLVSSKIYNLLVNKKIDKILVNPFLKEKMIEKGYIIDDTINEMEYIEYKYNSIVWDSEVLDLTFIMTHACNFQCIYCYQKEEKKSFSIDAIKKIKRFIERETKNNIKKVYINWFGGEPLLEKETLLDLSDFILKIGKINKFTYLGRITTNGYLLTENLFLNLLNSHIFFYMITIDGIKEYHDKQRPLKNGKGTYDRIMENLQAIKKINRSYSIDIRVNVSRDNYPYIEEFLKKWNLEFEEDRRFHIVLEPVHDWKGERIKTHQEQVISDIKLISALYKEAARQGTNLQDYLKYNSEVQFCAASKKKGYVIMNDASVHKCEMAMSDEVYKEANNIGFIDNSGKIHIDPYKEAKWLVD